MSAVATDYREAIAHLPAGAALRVDDVSWEDYENLLDDLGESYSVRIFYDRGRMEIVPPLTYEHDKPKGIIFTLIGLLPAWITGRNPRLTSIETILRTLPKERRRTGSFCAW